MKVNLRKMILNFGSSQFLKTLTQKVGQDIKKSFEYAHWDIESIKFCRRLKEIQQSFLLTYVHTGIDPAL